MKKLALLVAVVVTVILAVTLTMFSLGEPPVSRAERASDPIALHERTHASTRERAGHRDGEPGARGPASAAADDPTSVEARAQLRARILAAQQARDARAETVGPEVEPSPEVEPGLTPRIPGHQALLAELDGDFMPLADECIEQAREREPQLAGMLAIGLEIVVDEDLGAVVELVDFPEQNRIEQAELQTCVRESLLSMLLPPPDEGDSGREQLLLTIPIEP